MKTAGAISFLILLISISAQAKSEICAGLFKAQVKDFKVPEHGFLTSELYKDALSYFSKKDMYFKSDAEAAMHFNKVNQANKETFSAIRRMTFFIKISNTDSRSTNKQNFVDLPPEKIVLYINGQHSDLIPEVMNVFGSRVIDAADMLQIGFLLVLNDKISNTIEHHVISNLIESKHPTSQSGEEFKKDRDDIIQNGGASIWRVTSHP